MEEVLENRYLIFGESYKKQIHYKIMYGCFSFKKYNRHKLRYILDIQ